MSRLFAVAAAALLLGTGCVTSDTCDVRTVSVGWSSFQLADGSLTSSCRTAGVDTVEVFLDGTSVVRTACSDGGVNVSDVVAGRHVWTVEGLQAGAIVLRDFVETGGDGCNTLLRDSRPAEGSFSLAYSFTPVNTCTAGGSFIWFSVLDETAGTVTVAVDENSSDPRFYTCGTAISFALPMGPYTLQRTEEVTSNGNVFQAQAANCNAAAFDVVGGSLTEVRTALVDTATLCP